MSRKLKIVTGTDSFKELITTSDVFVDKSLFIKEIVDSGDKAILITRPRRWGKSLALDMLKTFFAIEVDAAGNSVDINANRVLFEGGDYAYQDGRAVTIKTLKPTKLQSTNADIITKHQGAYPVIFLSLKDAKYCDYESAEAGFKAIISRFFQDFRYLANSVRLFGDQKTKFNKFINTPQDLTIEELKDSLRFLTELLHKHHGQKVYVLVDEFDKPVNYFLEHGLYENIDERRKVAELVTSIMGACGKTNEHLEKIILTGIFDAFTKEGSSGFNNLQVFGIGYSRFAESFGFSEDEIKEQLLTPMGIDHSAMKQIKEWYNGYRLPLVIACSLEVYTAWAVMRHISAINHDPSALPQGYWEESGVNWVLNTLQIPQETLEALKSISDGTPSFLSTPSASLMTILPKPEAEIDPSLITYLLFNSGYLTLTEESKFRLPNREVHGHFRNTVLKRWIGQELATLGADPSTLQKALSDTLHDKNKFLEILQKSIIDKVGGGDKSEAYFQSLIGGIIELYHFSNPDSYQAIVEKPVKGAGRIDNIFYPAAGDTDKPVIIHEYKKLDKTQASVVDLTLEQSIWQTLEQGYLGEPISKKKAHSSLHTWNKIELRGIVFIKDETNGTWSVQSSQVLSLSFEEAEKIYGFFEDSFVRKMLECTDSKTDTLRQKLLQEAAIDTSSSNKIQDLCKKILDATNPLLEELKKKTIDVIKGLLTDVTYDDQKIAVAKIILDHAGDRAKDIDSEVTKNFSSIKLGETHKAILVVADTKQRKIPKSKRDQDIAAASGSQMLQHSLMSTEGVDKFYFKYYGSGIDSLLQIRLRSVNPGKNVVILGSSYLLKDNIYLLLERALGKMKEEDGIAALPLNIEGKHWVGLLIAKQGTGLTITYLDSENLTLEIDIKKEINRWASYWDYDVQFRTVQFEQQRYGNCGPELIENFAYLLGGHRATQEGAVVLHSLLYQDTVLYNDGSSTTSRNSFLMKQLTGLDPIYRYTTSSLEKSFTMLSRNRAPTIENKVKFTAGTRLNIFNAILSFAAGVNHYVEGLFERSSYHELQTLTNKYNIEVKIVDERTAREAYKQIALKTHPDKVSGNIDDFRKAKELLEKPYKSSTSDFNSYINIFKNLNTLHSGVRAIPLINYAIRFYTNPKSDITEVTQVVIGSGYLVETVLGQSIGIRYVSYFNMMYQLYSEEYQSAFSTAIKSVIYLFPGLLISSAPILAISLEVALVTYDAYYVISDLYTELSSLFVDDLFSRSINNKTESVYTYTILSIPPIDITECVVSSVGERSAISELVDSNICETNTVLNSTVGEIHNTLD
jgi:hypothetical protein